MDDLIGDFENTIGKPMPEGCDVPPRDLEFPDMPPGTNRGIRIVYIDGDYIPALSEGKLIEYLQSDVQVTPKPGGFRWGEDCEGMVMFAFVSDPEIDTAAPGDNSAGGESTAGSTSRSGQGAQIVAGTSNSQPPTIAEGSNQSDNQVSDSGSQGELVPGQNGESADSTEQCTPPPPLSARKVVVPHVKYIVSGCAEGYTRCAADAAVGECENVCERWQDPAVIGPVPDEKATVGIVLPDGEKIEWGRGMAETGSLIRHDYSDHDAGDIDGPWLKLFSLSNGVSVTQDDITGYITSVPVSMLPFWAGASTSVVPETETQPAEVNAELKLNGGNNFDHLFFYKDGGQFSISIANTTGSDDQSISTYQSECAESTNVKYSVVINRDLDSGGTVPEFFSGVGDAVPGILAPGENVSFDVLLNSFAEKIKLFEFDKDLLYGVEFRLLVWREHDETMLHSQNFSVYRFVDVADAHHDDNKISMAKTFTDGPGHVVRHRGAKFYIAKKAELSFKLQPQTSYKVIQAGTDSEFQFDPEISVDPARKFIEGKIDLEHVGDGKQIASIDLRGETQPITFIVFNEDLFNTVMDVVHAVASLATSAQENTTDYRVHPALVTNSEREFFNTSAKRTALAERIKDKMMALWGSDFSDYIQWAPTPHPTNGVELNWTLQHNAQPFAYGLTPADEWGPGTDSFADITSIINQSAQINRAEIAYRLNLAINHNLRKGIRLWPDSVLESHAGEIGTSGVDHSTTSMTETQFIDGMAKTAVHEIGHSMGLNHVAQSNIDFQQYGYQLLEFNNALPTATKVKLTINGESVDIPLYDDFKKNVKLTRNTLQTLINSLPSVGVKNYETRRDANNNTVCCTDNPQLGAIVYRCDDSRPQNNTDILAPNCPSGGNSDQKFLVSWNGHIGPFDFDPITLSDGQVTILRHTVAKRFLRRNVDDGICKHAVIDLNGPGITQQTLFNDIMHGGVNDINGYTRFQPGVSLEPMKISLGINYTLDDVSKVIDLFKSKIRSYADYGSDNYSADVWCGARTTKVFSNPTP